PCFGKSHAPLQSVPGWVRRRQAGGEGQGDPMTYQVPVEDIRFVFNELADLDGILRLPPHAELDSETIDAILQENAKFVEEVIAPLNRKGDLDPPKWLDGQVRTTPGFKEAFQEFGRGGWQGLLHEPKWGGQGLPKL